MFNANEKKGVLIQESGQLYIDNHGDTESMEYHGDENPKKIRTLITRILRMVKDKIRNFNYLCTSVYSVSPWFSLSNHKAN